MNYIVSLKETRNPLEDLLVPVEERIGYIAGKSPVLPIYFYRLLGVDGEEENDLNIYRNELYRLDEQLTQTGRYTKIESPILTPQNHEMAFFKSLLGSEFSQDCTVLKKLGMDIFQKSRIFARQPNYQNIRRALEQVLELYLRNESFTNTSKMETFLLKMIIWLQRLLSTLFPANSSGLLVPKVLFYGDIKGHEVYFLIFLSLIGTDILYIHTEPLREQKFSQIDPNDTYSKRMLFSNSFPIAPFPTELKRVRKKTVAFEAKEEIEDLLYGEDVGIFKSRQFEEGFTKPITLRTTHDEMKILWQEEAKIRPEFQVKNNIVYVPNLFVKVSGTYKQLDDYWKELFEMKDAPHTVFKDRVDFTPVTYSRQEMYSTSFVFDSEGFVDNEALFKHASYKLNYLNQSVQNFIVRKINELIKSDMLLQNMSNDLKVKILMTIITMEKDFLRLIETFDYTGKVPKIIIYHNNSESLTESDIILLCFFNLMGADILIYTPTNYNNIEAWVNRNYFDIHLLPDVQFDLELPTEKPKQKTKTSFIQKILNWRTEGD